MNNITKGQNDIIASESFHDDNDVTRDGGLNTKNK